jgi:hypothetical protein
LTKHTHTHARTHARTHTHTHTPHIDIHKYTPNCVRFWGTPIPIWASEDGEEIRVVGSIQELEELSGKKVGASTL